MKANFDTLLAEVERVTRALDAAVVRVQAETERHERMRDHTHHEWLADILADLQAISGIPADSPTPDRTPAPTIASYTKTK